MVVLARSVDPVAGPAPSETRAPWQTRFARVPVAPPAGRPVAPIAIPVVVGRPIDGPRLTRAPWAEPLAAFAGVVVETQRVPDGWLAAGRIPRPLVAIPVVADAAPSQPPRRLTPIPPLDAGEPGRLVAIPVAVPIRAAAVASPVDAPLPGRVVPFRMPAPQVVAAPAPPAAPAPIPARSSAPPAHAAIRPRRGFLARSTSLALAVIGTLTLLVRR